MDEKQLKLNVNKIECLIVGKKCDMLYWESEWQTALQCFDTNGRYINVSSKVNNLGDIIEEHLNSNGHIDEVTMIAWRHLHANAFMTKILIIALYDMFVHNHGIRSLNSFCNLVCKNNNWISCKLLSIVRLLD